MKKENNTGINFFQRYLTVGVFLCMVVGVLLGHFIPVLPSLLDQFEYARISIPMAILIFKAFITPELATQYLAGAVLLGAAPCTAMVFVWSTLTKGNPAYTVVQAAS